MDMIAVYQTPPQKERKAVDEIRDAGHKAYCPLMKINRRVSHRVKRTIAIYKPIAPGYVMATGKPSEARHVRAKVGATRKADVINLYRATKAKRPPPRPAYAIGDTVTVTVGPYAEITGTITQERGRAVIIQPHGTDRTISVSTYHLQRPPA